MSMTIRNAGWGNRPEWLIDLRAVFLRWLVPYKQRGAGWFKPFQHYGGNFARAENRPGIENLDADQIFNGSDIERDFFGQAD